MKKGIERLREAYESFKKGDKSALSVKSSALSLLDIATTEGNVKVVEEIKDVLLDLEFSISENKCNCHKGHSCC